MRTTRRKTISILLSIVMALTILPLSVFATDEDTTSSVTDLTTPVEPEKVNDVYQIGTTNELYWYANTINATQSPSSDDFKAILTADINFNPGVTFEYQEESGCIAVRKMSEDGQQLEAFLGTGLNGTENGMWLYSLTYTHPFNMSFSGENEFNDSYFKDYDTDGDDRFEYHFKWYGENDLGGYTPPSVSASLAYAYRGQENFVHSFGITFSEPLGVAWISSEKVGTYDPRPDPDHKAWSFAFVYGLEFSRVDYPIFLAFSLPLHDKSNGADALVPFSPAKRDKPAIGEPQAAIIPSSELAGYVLEKINENSLNNQPF